MKKIDNEVNTRLKFCKEQFETILQGNGHKEVLIDNGVDQESLDGLSKRVLKVLRFKSFLKLETDFNEFTRELLIAWSKVKIEDWSTIDNIDFNSITIE